MAMQDAVTEHRWLYPDYIAVDHWTVEARFDGPALARSMSRSIPRSHWIRTEPRFVELEIAAGEQAGGVDRAAQHSAEPERKSAACYS
jgi:hypothetical protein